MRHGMANKKLNRTSEHRKALLKNMLNSLIKYEQIKTTLPKAKFLKPQADKIITLGKKDNLHNTKILISQPLEKTMSSISSLIKVISEKDPGQWRKLINTYSRYSKQNKSEFYFHFYVLKIWFQAANRLTKNIDHVLHKTSFIEDMKIFIKRNPNADFSSIIYELEKPIEAVKNNYYMPLVLINLLLEIQKHFKR